VRLTIECSVVTPGIGPGSRLPSRETPACSGRSRATASFARTSASKGERPGIPRAHRQSTHHTRCHVLPVTHEGLGKTMRPNKQRTRKTLQQLTTKTRSANLSPVSPASRTPPLCAAPSPSPPLSRVHTTYSHRSQQSRNPN
jgi:hypothetical protein